MSPSQTPPQSDAEACSPQHEAADKPVSSVRVGLSPIAIEDALKLWRKHMVGLLQFSGQHADKSVRTVRQIAAELEWSTTADLCTDRLVDWLSEQINAGGPGAAKTAKNKLSQVRCFGAYLEVKRHFTNNPFDAIRLPRCRRGKGADAFTWEQMQAIILNAEKREAENWQARHKGPLASTFYGFLALSGLRYREARRQRWEDINLAKKVLRLTGDKSKRNDLIPMNEELVALLMDWRNHSKGELVFDRAPSHHTLEVDMKAVGIARGKEVAGEKGQWHRWRKGVNTQMARQGIDVDVRRKLMRHTDEKLTMDVYTDPRLLPLAQAANQLPRLNGFMERARKIEPMDLTPGGQIAEDVGAEALPLPTNLADSPSGFAVFPPKRPQQSPAEKREPPVEAASNPKGRTHASGEMEPGGIEPPSRDSQQVASTRVVVDLSSTAEPPTTAFPLVQPTVVSHRRA